MIEHMEKNQTKIVTLRLIIKLFGRFLAEKFRKLRHTYKLNEDPLCGTSVNESRPKIRCVWHMSCMK